MKKGFLNFFLFWFPLILYCGLIFFLSSLSSPDTGFVLPDYLLHTGEYAFLAFLFVRALNRGTFNIRLKFVIYAAVFSILYGIIDEMHQYFTPLRTPDFYDVLYDVAGSLLGAFGIFTLEGIIKYVSNKRKKQL